MSRRSKTDTALYRPLDQTSCRVFRALDKTELETFEQPSFQGPSPGPNRPGGQSQEERRWR